MNRVQGAASGLKTSRRPASLRNRLILVGVAPLVLVGLLTFCVQVVRLNEAKDWFQVAENTHLIQGAVGELRRGEKDFLLRDRRSPSYLETGESVNLSRVDAAIRSIATNLVELQSNSLTRGDSRPSVLLQEIGSYSNLFSELRRNVHRMGGESYGLEGEWRGCHRAMVARHSGNPEAVALLASLETGILGYLLRAEAQEYRTVESTMDRLAVLLGPDPDLSAYRAAIVAHHALAVRNGLNEREGLQGGFRSAIHRLSGVMDGLIEDARTQGHRAHVSTLNASATMLGISFAGAVLVLAYLARGIVGPLRSLTAAANRFRGGRLEEPVPSASVLELRELAEAFNAMGTALSEARRTLEARVEARTRDLAEAKASLEERNNQLGFLVEQLKQSAAESARLARESEQANEAKSRFLAVMSHELRTPINGMLGFSEFLAESPLNEDQRQQVRIIRDSAEHLLRIVNEILDISRIEQGRMDVVSQEVDLVPIAREVVGLLQASAGSKGVECVLETRFPSMPVAGDPLRLKQVLLNLVGNAVKFTDRGSVRLRVSAAEDSAVVEVRDTGPGIPQEMIPKLFNKFVQVDASHSRRHGGVGLGLAISKALVEQMGGTIVLESELGVGSCFRIRLPLAAPLPSPADAVDRSHPRGTVVQPDSAAAPELCSLERGDGFRVLIAEDNEVNARLVSRFAGILGMQPTVVSDGTQLVEAFGDATWDLLIVDWQMPEMDGLEAVRRIRSMEVDGRRVPILLLTANAMAGDGERCTAAGADAFLFKPIRRAEFEAVVRRICPVPVPEAAR